MQMEVVLKLEAVKIMITESEHQSLKHLKIYTYHHQNIVMLSGFLSSSVIEIGN